MEPIITFKEALGLIKQSHSKILSLLNFEGGDKREMLCHVSCLLSDIAYDLEYLINENGKN